MGFREFQGQIVREGERMVLHLEGHGPITPLDYIKQGFRVLEASPEELKVMSLAGYSVKVESR